MSGMASNYDMARLLYGILIAAVAVFLAGISSYFLLRQDETLSSVGPFVAMTLAYGVMMFASSYVEEEHHFWYWATSAWLLWTGVRAING
jgi:ethanolamine phosphate transferase 2 subunit G